MDSKTRREHLLYTRRLKNLLSCTTNVQFMTKLQKHSQDNKLPPTSGTFQREPENRGNRDNTETFCWFSGFSASPSLSEEVIMSVGTHESRSASMMPRGSNWATWCPRIYREWQQQSPPRTGGAGGDGGEGVDRAKWRPGWRGGGGGGWNKTQRKRRVDEKQDGVEGTPK